MCESVLIIATFPWQTVPSKVQYLGPSLDKLFSSSERINSDPIRINEAKSILGGKWGI